MLRSVGFLDSAPGHLAALREILARADNTLPTMQNEPDPPPALPFSGSREFVHRLNNLLTVVLAHAESSLASDDPEEMRRALRVIVEASVSMAKATRVYARPHDTPSSASRTPRSPEGQ